jgi:hypothetical protein
VNGTHVHERRCLTTDATAHRPDFRCRAAHREPGAAPLLRRCGILPIRTVGRSKANAHRLVRPMWGRARDLSGCNHTCWQRRGELGDDAASVSGILSAMPTTPLASLMSGAELGVAPGAELRSLTDTWRGTGRRCSSSAAAPPCSPWRCATRRPRRARPRARGAAWPARRTPVL